VALLVDLGVERGRPATSLSPEQRAERDSYVQLGRPRPRAAAPSGSYRSSSGPAAT